VAEESIINDFSVVVNAKALAFSFNSTLLNNNHQYTSAHNTTSRTVTRQA
jgi:hypothetical protein